MTTVKNLLLAVIVFACVCSSVMSADLQFDTNSTPQQWIVDKAGGGETAGKGPIKPTHAAVLYIANAQNFPEGWITPILSTSYGYKMSEQQKNLLATGQGVCRIGSFGDTLPNHYHFTLYAVSEEDARKMAQAVVEVLTKEPAIRLTLAQQTLDELVKNKTTTEEKLKQAEDLIAKDRRITTLSPDEIRKTISQMEEQRNLLLIDIAGMKAKIAAIREVLADKGISNEIRAKLQQELFDQNIDLAAAMAKLETIENIRVTAETKYKDSCLLHDREAEVQKLRADLENLERMLSKIRENYERVRGETVLPQVFQNKVTIYPVSADKNVQK